jgi:hypothetical protein
VNANVRFQSFISFVKQQARFGDLVNIFLNDLRNSQEVLFSDTGIYIAAPRMYDVYKTRLEMQELKITTPRLQGMEDTVEALKNYANTDTAGEIKMTRVVSKKDYLFMTNKEATNLIGLIISDDNLERRLKYNESVEGKGYANDNILISLSNIKL